MPSAVVLFVKQVESYPFRQSKNNKYKAKKMQSTIWHCFLFILLAQWKGFFKLKSIRLSSAYYMYNTRTIG